MPLVNEEAIELGLPNVMVNSYGVSCRAKPNKWMPRGWMLVYVVVSVQYGYRSITQLSTSLSSAHTLHVYERAKFFKRG